MIPSVKTLNKRLQIISLPDCDVTEHVVEYNQSFDNVLKAMEWSEQDLLFAINKEWNDIFLQT